MVQVQSRSYEHNNVEGCGQLSNDRLYKSRPVEHKSYKTIGDKTIETIKLAWKEEEIKWGNDLHFPDLAGSTLTIKYIPQKGDEYDFEHPKDKIIPQKRITEFEKKVWKSTWLLYIQHGLLLPQIIKVNDTGKCILIMATKNDISTSYDIILREGYTEVVRKSK